MYAATIEDPSNGQVVVYIGSGNSPARALTHLQGYGNRLVAEVVNKTTHGEVAKRSSASLVLVLADVRGLLSALLGPTEIWTLAQLDFVTRY